MQVCLDNLKKKIENNLKTKSEIVYVFPAIPCIVNFFLAVVSASIYISKKSEYTICNLKGGDTDKIGTFLIGQIIIMYIFLGFYSNILLEYIPKLNGLVWNFLYLVFYTLGSFIWVIIGSSNLGSSYCNDTAYYRASLANVIIYWIQFGGFVIYTGYILISKQLQTAKVGQNPQSQPQQQQQQQPSQNANTANQQNQPAKVEPKQVE